MGVSSTGPTVESFFLSSESEQWIQLGKALKEKQLDFIREIINTSGCSKRILKRILLGCVLLKASDLVAIDLIRRNIFSSDAEKHHLLMEAVGRGNQVIVEEFLTLGISPEIRSQALIKALSEGKKEVSNILFFHAGVETIALKQKGNILILAAFKGQQAIVEALRNVGIPKKDQEEALIAALGFDHFEVANILFSSLDPASITDQNRGAIFIKAAKKGQKSMVEALITMPISSKDREEALLAAFSFNHIEIVDILLSARVGFCSIIDEKKEEFLLLATKKGSKSLVEALLKRAIIPKNREEALLEALIKNAFEIANILFSSLEVAAITDEKIGQILLLAAKKGQKPMVEALLTRPILLKDQEEAIIQALSFDHFETANILFSNIGMEALTNESRGQILIIAAIKGQKSLIELLWTTSILPKDRDQAIVQALLLDHFEIANILFAANGGVATITDKKRGEILVLAAQKGLTSIVEALLPRPILPKDWEEAIMEALIYDHFEIANIFFADSGCVEMITKEKIGQILLLAAKKGQKPMVEALLTRPILLKDQEEAIIQALSFDHFETANILFSRIGIEAITKETRGKILILAAQRGQKSLIELLLTNSILPEDRDEAKTKALSGGFSEIAALL